MRALHSHCSPAALHWAPVRSGATVASVTRTKRKTIAARALRRLHCTRKELLALIGASAVLTMVSAGGAPMLPTFAIFAAGLLLLRAAC